jgi:tetrahydromethanopterin S-methyltransferase subunit A
VTDQSSTAHPDIIGDVVFGGPTSTVAVCTLASRRLLPLLAGRPEIGIAGRVFTENVGVERMVQNLVAHSQYRFMIVCGRESQHRVGQTILALHRVGLDASARVIGSDGPEPFLPNLTDAQLRAFQERVTLVDMIGIEDADAIVARAAELQAEPSSKLDPGAEAVARIATETIVAAPTPPTSWEYDPAGFYLILVDRAHRRLRAEQYSQDRRLLRVFEGRNAQELCHTIVREAQVTLLAHAAYLGRELAKADAALHLDLEYEQDAPLRADRPRPAP